MFEVISFDPKKQKIISKLFDDDFKRLSEQARKDRGIIIYQGEFVCENRWFHSPEGWWQVDLRA